MKRHVDMLSVKELLALHSFYEFLASQSDKPKRGNTTTDLAEKLLEVTLVSD
jgi:hypothetical protein